jgi:hypothetical protein
VTHSCAGGTQAVPRHSRALSHGLGGIAAAKVEVLVVVAELCEPADSPTWAMR